MIPTADQILAVVMLVVIAVAYGVTGYAVWRAFKEPWE